MKIADPRKIYIDGMLLTPIETAVVIQSETFDFSSSNRFAGLIWNVKAINLATGETLYEQIDTRGHRYGQLSADFSNPDIPIKFTPIFPEHKRREA